MKGILQLPYYNCWQRYAKAIKIICAHAISKTNIIAADDLLQQYCNNFEQLCGSASCTISMRKHLHLMKCMYDYGPIYSFWCFPLERFNGQLDSFQTNSKNVELQIMRKILRSQTISSLPTAEEEILLSVPLPPISRTRYHQLLQLQTATLPLSTFAFAMLDSDFGTYIDTHKAKAVQTVLSAVDQQNLLRMYEATAQESHLTGKLCRSSRAKTSCFKCKVCS